MNLFNNKRILVLAPHTDDGEFGCGGTIAQCTSNGTEVYYAAFSACSKSVLPGFAPDVLVTEVKAATRVLGIKPENLILYDYDVRSFNFHRQEILENILELKRDIQPDLIMVPSLRDIHQDHYTISQEAVRAFKFSTILCYELPWNNFNFHTTCFVHLADKFIRTKVDAVKEYKSQQHRTYANEDFIYSLARTRGVQCGQQYAEVFEVVRLIIK